MVSDCVIYRVILVADQIELRKRTMETFFPEASLEPHVKHALHSSNSPNFARGAGPHVDDYMKMEMEAKKRKEKEHRVSAES